MPTVERLRSGGDVRAVFAARQVVHGSFLVVHLRARGDHDPGRATAVAGRKVGTATRRNRAKRRLRAAIAQVGLPGGMDAVVVARSAALVAPFPALVGELAELIERGVARYGSRVG